MGYGGLWLRYRGMDYEGLHRIFTRLDVSFWVSEGRRVTRSRSAVFGRENVESPLWRPWANVCKESGGTDPCQTLVHFPRIPGQLGSYTAPQMIRSFRYRDRLGFPRTSSDSCFVVAVAPTTRSKYPGSAHSRVLTGHGATASPQRYSNQAGTPMPEVNTVRK